MLTKTHLMRRVVSSVLLLDFFFTALFGLVYCYLLMVPISPRIFGEMALCFVVRGVVYGAVMTRLLGPVLALQGTRSHKQRTITPEALREADRLLLRAPLWGSLCEAGLWAAQIPFVSLLESAAGNLGVQAGAEVLSMQLGMTGGVGSFAITLPLLSWALAGIAGDNSKLAREREIELDRPPSSIPARIVTQALCLGIAPSLLLAALGLSSQVRNLSSQLRVETELATSEMSRLQLRADVSAEKLLEPLRKDNNTTLFLLDRAGTLRLAGPQHSWLDPSWARKAQLNTHLNPERGVFVRVVSLSDGTLAGAVARLAGPPREYLASLFLVTLVILLWSPLCAWLLSRSVAGPLNDAALATRRLVEEGDLSQIGSLPIAQQDEVGTVLSHMNELIDTMQALATAASAVKAGNLEVPIVGRGELPEAFRAMVSGLNDVVQQLQGTSTELASAAAEISAATQEQEAAAASHSSGMVEITQTMDSLARSAAHVAEAVGGVLQNAERTLENTDQMVARISALTAQANRIGDILEVIRDIADRTDLLALNGSLEATRAGESGRGFALVAAEMRRLAERVTSSVQDIKTLVAEIRESGASTVVATEESKKLAQRTTEAARNITLVTQQQRTSTEQVTQSVRSVAEIIQQAATATLQTRTSAEGLKAHADRLRALVQRFQLQA